MHGAPLPKGLQSVLSNIVNRDFAGRMAHVCQAAARCIEQLQAVTLVSLEPATAEEGTADLALWEQMAPAVAETVASVTALCQVIEQEFPDAITRSGVFSAETSDERAEAEAALVFRTVSSHLRRELEQVRSMVRRPELMASRWALLEELQRLRADFRRRVGDAVYLSAAAATMVNREDVVPGASQEVQRALLYRATAADLIKQVRARFERTEDIEALVSSIASDLKLFTSMPAWKYVHAGPKRQLMSVQSLLGRSKVDKAALIDTLGPLMETLADVADELTREVLASHDLHVFNDAAFRLEQAKLHVKLGTEVAAWAFGGALTLTEALRGRSERIDTVLRHFKRNSVEDADEVTVAKAIDELRQALREVA
jgi:hypothetical protein